MKFFSMTQKQMSVALRVLEVLCLPLILVLLEIAAKTLRDCFAEADYAYLLHCIPYPFMMAGVFVALWEGWCLFREIGRDNSFCVKNALRLRRIGGCALVDAGLSLLSGVLWAFGGWDFGGPLLAFGFLAVLGVAAAIVCSALSQLTMKAAKLQDDSDLTI